MESLSHQLRVTEVFYSIQGESSFVGRPCVFVRLTGCPLRCTWCDTDYAFYGGTERSIKSLLDEVKRYNCQLVEITGGEPLHQLATIELLSTLCQEGFQVLLETSGAIDVTLVDRRVHIILDVKCPGSGMAERMHWVNLEHLSAKDEVKFVLKDRHDYDWAVDIVAKYRLSDRCLVLFSPVFGELALQSLAEWILQDRLAVRLQLQLHKYIWDPQMHGV